MAYDENILAYFFLGHGVYKIEPSGLRVAWGFGIRRIEWWKVPVFDMLLRGNPLNSGLQKLASKH